MNAKKLTEEPISKPEGKIRVLYFALQKELVEQTGIQHGTEIDELDLHKTINGLYSLGLNVMLIHAGPNTNIWVDTKKFGQR